MSGALDPVPAFPPRLLDYVPLHRAYLCPSILEPDRAVVTCISLLSSLLSDAGLLIIRSILLCYVTCAFGYP